MDTKILIAIIVPIVVVGLSYLFEKSRERAARLHERKMELYKSLVFSLKGFFQENPDATLKQNFVDETRLARLYASDEAIKALNKFADIMKRTEREIEKEIGKDYQKVAHGLFGEFMAAMRKDLGIKTKLSPEELGRTERVK